MSSILKYFQDIYPELIINNDIIDKYSNYDEEINSVKYGVGIYNRSESAVLKLTGNDVLDFLQRISTNDVNNLEQFHYVITLFTNEKGRLIDRTVLLRVEERFYLIGSKRNDAALYRWLNRYIITEDVKVENLTNDYLILDIIGPQAESYLTLICGKEVDNLDNNQLHEIGINDTKSYLLKKRASSGEDLYWIIAKMSDAKILLDYLLSHRSVFDLSMVGEKAFDYYRTINLIPKFPNEINDSFNPHETGLINEVSTTKGCYIGQEVVARLDTYDKVQKNLRKVEVEGIKSSDLPIEFYEKNDELIGILTTCIESKVNSHIEGLAFIKRSYENKKELSGVKSSSGD
ncbi:MAG: hypothetical protein R3250_13015 [Melioribacteraceae bacterium]|nr:hypothetical protein [Melioribacteraceae bacterium]